MQIFKIIDTELLRSLDVIFRENCKGKCNALEKCRNSIGVASATKVTLLKSDSF